MKIFILNLTIFSISVFAFLCIANTSTGEMRTWTSGTGSTLEAEMVDVQGTQVVLKSAEGKEFKIGISMLSDADQVFIRANTKSTPPPKQESKTPAKRFAYEKPTPPASFPSSVKLRSPENARYLLIQYGPKAEEVIHVAFDPSGMTVAAEAAYIWSPTLPSFKTPKRILGKSRKVEKNDAYIYTIPVSTTFGDIGVTGNIELTYGASQWWLIHGLGDFTLKKGHNNSSFKVAGFIFDYSSEASDTKSAKPVRFLGPVYFYLTSNDTGMTTVRLWMNRLGILPGAGMDSDVALTFHEKEGKKIDDDDVEVTENMLFKDIMARYIYYSTSKYSSGNEYLVRATIDLGPAIGTYEKEVSVKKP